MANPHLNKIFNQVIEYTTPESIAEHAKNSQNQPLDEERKKFLEQALAEGSFGGYDVIAKIKQDLETCRDPGASEDDVLGCLESLQFECEQIDTAADLHKVGGLQVMVSLLEHGSAEVRMYAAWVIATATNQNPKVQEQAKEIDLLPTVLKRLDVETDAEAQQKLLLCVSAIVREDTSMHAPFVTLKGYEKVGALCKTPVLKLRRKAVFFLYAVAQQSTKEELEKAACTHGLLASLKSAAEVADEDVLQQVLNILALLSPPSEPVMDAARACELPKTLIALDSQLEPATKTALQDQLAAAAAFRG